MEKNAIIVFMSISFCGWLACFVVAVILIVINHRSYLFSYYYYDCDINNRYMALIKKTREMESKKKSLQMEMR